MAQQEIEGKGSMTEETRPVIAVTYDGDTHWLECFHGDMDADHGDVIVPVEAGDDFAVLAAKVAEHQAGHGCAVQRPEPGSDPAGLAVRFRFADIDIRATCECGWTATGDAATDAFSAWWKHRHDKHPDAA